MSRLVNLSDDVYAELTRIKRIRNGSYSEVVSELLKKRETAVKTMGLKELADWALDRNSRYKGRKERTDHDLILYGASRDSR